MQDIKNREDIIYLVDTFYNSVKADDTIGHIFNEIIGDDWSAHLPIMYSFWSSVLFAEAGYKGNPIKTHIDIDKRIKLKEEHFSQWLHLWETTVNKHFEGEVAELAKKRAATMVTLMTMKINDAQNPKHIY